MLASSSNIAGTLTQSEASLFSTTPPLVTHAVRVLQVLILTLVVWWVYLLGGLRLSPAVSDIGGANDTSGIFNWHPLMMTFAFVVCMGEAMLAYRAPLPRLPDRPARKAWHAALHASALTVGVLGLVAAVKSHTLKRPTPIPNLYSAHSWLGCWTCLLFVGQFCLGVAAFLAPKWSLASRAAFAPYHRFLGLATWVSGLATVAVGIQEKTTFVQVFGKPALSAAVMRVPAALQPLLAIFAAAVLLHHMQHVQSVRVAEQEDSLPRDDMVQLGAEEQPLRSHQI